MEDVCHNSQENTGNAELTTELTEMESWDSTGVSSKNIILSASQCSEENVLKCTFKACDPEQTGEVSVFRIIEYLQEMTGQSFEDWRFQSLYTRLDPEERGIAVDFPTFHQVMKDWISDCRKDGEEAADLMNSIEDLQHGNKQLAVQNIKLQRTIETAEELNLRLSEEIVELKGKLRVTQQALEQARAVANELEDLKFFCKNLEEENSKFHTQGRQLEKEQQCLLIQVDSLQEENRKLLLEKENCKNKIKQLCTEKAKIKSQLYECENLISCKDTDLNKKQKQTEELTVTLDEYQMMVQKLKLEVLRLQKQLCHSCEDRKGQVLNSLENVKTCCVQAGAQPLSVEIEESQKGSISSKADSTQMLLQKIYRSSHLSLVTDVQSTLKDQEYRQQQEHRTSELVESMKEQTQGSLASEQSGNSKLGVTQKSSKMETSTHFELGEEDEYTNLPEIPEISSAELRCEPAPEEQALIPVYHELVPAGRKKLFNKWFASLTEWFLDVPLGYLLLLILQKLVLLGLLIACVSLLTIVYLVPPYGHHLVWTEPRGNPWPQLQLQYLRPPPI
ncbi:protein KASH5 [Heteronotia binoei]|uniref:protein KASH5 n=1 Tax=Heteronotia binoei TaxID=13085 RepID=UPI00292EA0D5|nr:protein KASH5 [Heteronotia binoei]